MKRFVIESEDDRLSGELIIDLLENEVDLIATNREVKTISEKELDDLAKDIALKHWYEDNPDPFDKHRLIRACQEAAQKGAEWVSKR